MAGTWDKDVKEALGNLDNVRDVLERLNALREEAAGEIKKLEKQVGNLEDELFELKAQLDEAQAEAKQAKEQADRWALEVLQVRGTIGGPDDYAG